VLRDLLAELYHWFRRHWERLLHPWRRRRVLRQLRRHRMPRGVLFVCHGNICRSPYAAAAFRAQLGADAAQVIKVASAGFIGPIRPAPRVAQQEAASRGLDLSNHRSMTLAPVVLNSVDIVAVMEPDQVAGVRRLFPTSASIIVLGDLDPLANGGRLIIDPVDQSRAVFAASYDRIDRCVAVLARAVVG
jgi:protein-tyrosine-phosphatase